MTERSREVFRLVVESYLETGEPIGSRSISRELNENVSAATIRNVMQDLEFFGFLDSPHISAGRIPTQLGLRMFVDGMMEVGDISLNEQVRIEAKLNDDDLPSTSALLEKAGSLLSTLSNGAGLVLASKSEAPIKHIEFVSLSPERALVVLVTEDGNVENRIFIPPIGQTPSSMREAANFLNSFARGQTISALKNTIVNEMKSRRRELDTLAQKLVRQGVAVWSDQGNTQERLIVRGRANLLNDSAKSSDLDRIRELFDDLERKHDLVEFLELTDSGEGVRVFIGSENKLFSLSGSSLVVAPYMNADRKIIGAVGVIGPTRLNYGRIVPIVDYTAQLVGRLLTNRK